MCQCGQASFVDAPPATTTSSLSSVASSSDESCCVDAAGTALGGVAGVGGRSSPAYPTTQVADKRRDGGPPPSLTADAASAPVHHVLAPGSPAHGPGRHCLLWACKACKKKNMNIDRRKVRKNSQMMSVICFPLSAFSLATFSVINGRL